MLKSVHVWAVQRQPMRTKYTKIGMFIGSELLPDPDSRVTLSQRADALMLPIARTDWRISELDRRSPAVLAERVKAEFARLKLPDVQLGEWVRDGAYDTAVLSDGCPPTGTTHTASEARRGGFDPDCQMHGVDGLFVAGSSVFPTAGHANPTLMIVAVACRLADHLKRRLAQQAVPDPTNHAVPMQNEAVLADELAAFGSGVERDTRPESSRL